MEALLVFATFALLVMALCLWKPNAGRLVLGVFYLVMAFGVNLTIWITAPDLFGEMGRTSFIPFYQTIFRELIAPAPLIWGLVTIVYETTAGLLILSRGPQVKVGLVMFIVFLLGITPLGIEYLANPILALAVQYLLSKEFPLSAIDHIHQLRSATR